MICPDWLDQAFIISNSAVDYDENLIGSADFRPKPTSVRIDRYRNFVGQHPDKMTYFQPILDSLDIVPSRIDLIKKSVLTEGKSDYLFIKYGLTAQSRPLHDVSIVPTRGATGMNELVGLFIGWGIPFMILLDDDREGKAAAKKYLNDWHLESDQIITLGQISDTIKGKDIRAFLNETDEKMISAYFATDKAATKGQLQLFFSEMLARNQKAELSDHYWQCIEGAQQLIGKYLFPETSGKHPQG